MDNYQEGKYYLLLPVNGEETLKECQTRKEAEKLFTQSYEAGEECHWKGLWDGSTFIDKRPPVYLKGTYYFRVLTDGYPIPVSRKTRNEAVKTFFMYKDLAGACRWLGKWDGESFTDRKEPKAEDW